MLVAVLQLLDCAGKLAQRAFHAVEADRQIAGIGLCDVRLLRLRLSALALLRRLLAAAEQIIEETAGGTLLLSRRGASQQQGNRDERRGANWGS